MVCLGEKRIFYICINLDSTTEQNPGDSKTDSQSSSGQLNSAQSNGNILVKKLHTTTITTTTVKSVKQFAGHAIELDLDI